jgi:hypothetical protein
MLDVSKLKTADEARTLMANAQKKGRHDIYKAAFRRLGQIEGKDHDDPIVRQFWGAIAAVEEVLRQRHGRALKAAYTRRKVAKVGEIACLTDWALKKGVGRNSRFRCAIPVDEEMNSPSRTRRPRRTKFPVFSLLAGNFGIFRDEFADALKAGVKTLCATNGSTFPHELRTMPNTADNSAYPLTLRQADGTEN